MCIVGGKNVGDTQGLAVLAYAISNRKRPFKYSSLTLDVLFFVEIRKDSLSGKKKV